MSKQFLIILIISISLLGIGGCSLQSKVRDGGGAQLVSLTKVTETLPDNTVRVSENTTTVTLEQPENPAKGGELIVKKLANDEVVVSVKTSETLDTDATTANIASLKPVTYTGLGLVLTATVIGIFSKGKYWKQSLILGGVGGGLIVGAYLIPAYSIFFMIGASVLIIGAVAYFVWKNIIHKTALEENIDFVDGIKEKLTPEQKEEVFADDKGSLVNRSQSKETRKLVKKYRNGQKK